MEVLPMPRRLAISLFDKRLRNNALISLVCRAAEGVVAEGRAPAATDSHQSVEQRIGGRISAVVSSVSRECSSDPGGQGFRGVR
jgi:hypothetical protein